MKVLVLGLAGLAACATAPQTDLAAIIADPDAYRGQTLRTCGRVEPGSGGRHPIPPTLHAVDGQALLLLLKEAGRGPGEPEWRCLIGRVASMCGDAPPEDCVIVYRGYSGYFYEQ